MAERTRARSNPLRAIAHGLQNALEMTRLGRHTDADRTPFEVVHAERVYRLRRYPCPAGSVPRVAPGERGEGAVLLIPPLMLTSEIYDMAPDISVVRALIARGIEPWIVDFGAPEAQEGGMERTLDDHIRAVDDAVTRVREATGRDVHLTGYSQGGMFAYQAAAYRRSEGLRSVITFGSPVDIHRNLPNIDAGVAAEVFRAARAALDAPLDKVEGLPGYLTSTGFKLLSARKEVQQVVEFIRLLNDRQALERRAIRRRFLGGEGFVAWPGPALRTFIDEFVVHNRLASGGFVIDGRALTLADIRCPVLYFVGTRDSIAQPPSVRAIRRAAPNADLHEVPLKAGHFGLVIGSRANGVSWPAVAEWVRWIDGRGPRPRALAYETRRLEEPDEAAFDEVRLDFKLFYDAATDVLSGVWGVLGGLTKAIGDRVDAVRYQVDRLQMLSELGPDTPVGIARALAEQAQRIPERTFFLWHGRAFSYADADRRVDAVVRGFIDRGVRPGARVGVCMQSRPSYLSAMVALIRLGAVPVLMGSGLSAESIAQVLSEAGAGTLVIDPERVDRCAPLAGGDDRDGVDVLVLGGGGDARSLDDGVFDMESIDPAAVALPDWYEPNPGVARDLAMIYATVGRSGGLRLAQVTHGRWAFSAYGAAGACTLSPDDTVYCCLPLHHPAGTLVSVSGALVGGARLALAPRFDAHTFWGDVRRCGASVVFYAGEMLRPLIDAPASAADQSHPVRLFAGSGLRPDVWRGLVDRFAPAGVLELYASTEHHAVLANASGEKVGSVGRPLPGSAPVGLVRYDLERGAPAVDMDGRLERVRAGEVGALVAKVDPAREAEVVTRERVVEDAFAPGDAWFVTRDLMRRDPDGDYFFVDRASDVLRTPDGVVFSRKLEAVVHSRPEVALAAAYSVAIDGRGAEKVVVALVLRSGRDFEPRGLFDALRTELSDGQLPAFVRVLEAIPMTEGYRPIKSALRDERRPAQWAGQTFRLDLPRATYRPHSARKKTPSAKKAAPKKARPRKA